MFYHFWPSPDFCYCKNYIIIYIIIILYYKKNHYTCFTGQAAADRYNKTPTHRVKPIQYLYNLNMKQTYKSYLIYPIVPPLSILPQICHTSTDNILMMKYQCQKYDAPCVVQKSEWQIKIWKKQRGKTGYTPTPWDQFCWIKQLSQHRYLHVVLSVCVVGGKRKFISLKVTELSLESHGKQHKYVFIVWHFDRFFSGCSSITSMPIMEWNYTLNKIDTNQRGRFEVFDDGVLSHWQVELVATQDEPVVDGVSHQVDAGSHNKRDDAEVDCCARHRPGTALNQLIGAATHTFSRCYNNCLKRNDSFLLFNYFGYIFRNANVRNTQQVASSGFNNTITGMTIIPEEKQFYYRYFTLFSAHFSVIYSSCKCHDVPDNRNTGINP